MTMGKLTFLVIWKYAKLHRVRHQASIIRKDLRCDFLYFQFFSEDALGVFSFEVEGEDPGFGQGSGYGGEALIQATRKGLEGKRP